MAKIYTRTGDSGETSLLGGRRVRKDDLSIETIGSIDEVSAAIGVVLVELSRGSNTPAGLDQLLAEVQHRLFDLGADLAALKGTGRAAASIEEADIATLEAAIDQYDASLPPLRSFILPGGAPAAAQLHVARAACRRAERRLVELAASTTLRGEILRYVNRLSDLLFVAARAVNQANQVPDVIWEKKS
jgi:cob(I)alamin adenosyltransferase